MTRNSTSQDPGPAGAQEIRLDPVAAAVEAVAQGRPVVVVDDADRENEGDIVFAAEHATPELMGFTIRHTSGVVCVPMTGARADAMALPPMVAVNEDSKGTAYTITCDARRGVSTGISAADRAVTARVLADPAAGPGDIARPGHILPLRAAEGGVRTRRGHTEAAVELCALAGLEPVGVIAELVHDEGSMMRLPALRAFADRHGMPLVSIEDLAAQLREGRP
jgi:3,4-dihydroxy-2-butanone 4-phosphate synthase